MTAPELPDPPVGRFVTFEAVQARFEKTISSNRVDSVKWRIFDVENELLGEVPSLRDLDPDTGDEVRVGRVQSLIIDKVLELYRNPGGASSISQAMGDLSSTHGYRRDGSGPRLGIQFTEEELARVRPPRRRRPKLGTFGVRPFQVPR